MGRLLAELELDDETLVVLTSDHGEDLGDREPLTPGNHGHSLYDELLLVPLVIRDPTRNGEESEDRLAWSRAKPGEKIASLRTPSHKLIVNALDVATTRGAVIELYDLRSDPDERRSLAAQSPPEKEALLSEIRALRERLEAERVPLWVGSAELPERVRSQLRALGYID